MKTVPANRATWWMDTCQKARAALTNEWESVPELTKRTGFSGLVFASLHLSGHADLRLDSGRANIVTPAAHVFYKMPSSL